MTIEQLYQTVTPQVTGKRCKEVLMKSFSPKASMTYICLDWATVHITTFIIASMTYICLDWATEHITTSIIATMTYICLDWDTEHITTSIIASMTYICLDWATLHRAHNHIHHSLNDLHLSRLGHIAQST